MSDNYQPGILEPVPGHARYLLFSLKSNPSIDPALQNLISIAEGANTVVGLGLSLIQTLKKNIDGLKAHPVIISNGIEIPSTPVALCCWIRGEDSGELVHQTRQLCQLLAPGFQIIKTVDAFRYDSGLDLTGYEDGTENPTDDDAIKVAIISGKGQGLDGSSFMVAQQWVHDLDYFQSLSTEHQDHTFGRRISDNDEIDNAPKSAHVKRTAQEDFVPEAFIVRRSMPWADATEMGLVFVAFGQSFHAYEALLNRMVGADDGITDALFSFTRAITGSYFWCPPLKKGRLDLSAIDL